MTEEQADQVIDFLIGMHRPPDPVATRNAWRLHLRALDAECASQAAINGTKVWDRFPTWPAFYTEYRTVADARDVAAASDLCSLCEGDGFVMVGTRLPITTEWMRKRELKASDIAVEEYAACPECNPSDTSFRRYDGSVAKALDPAKVLELMRK
ncbi:MAG: hypothetical protein KatS3mg015_2467 [Fimbriimonadales bacterium]|nr:MAG: hypothetical protein KatS3mg015_2467 [Fimbriimonadales bacterium]